MTLLDDSAHDMPLGDVRGFVRHHSGQFIFVAGRQYQAALDGNETARHRKSIDDRVLQHEAVELMLAFLSMALQAVANLLNVILDLRVFEDLPGLAYLGKPAHPSPVFFVERNG